jgi:hypothetical protein
MVGSPVRIPLARRLATLLVVAAIATALGGVAPAAAGGKPMPAGGKPMPAGAGQHCVVVLDKLRPGQTTSRTLSRTCADRTDAPALTRTAAASTLLLVLYQDVNFGGASTKIYGAYGPCDAEGYGFSNLGTWRNRVSSLKGFNWCNVVDLYDNINYGGAFLAGFGGCCSRLDVPWVSSYANDRTDSILTWRQ